MDPSIETTTKLERYKTNDLRPSNRRIRSAIENNAFIRGLLKVLAVVGVSLIIADGVLTPAQSVLGAIQGIKVVDDGLTYKTIVGISVAILVVLYGLQPLGITKIAGAWAPIVIVWLTFNLAFGIYVCSACLACILCTYRLVLESGPPRLHGAESVLALLCWSLFRSQWHRRLEVARRYFTGIHWC